jgi:hypothetical protein
MSDFANTAPYGRGICHVCVRLFNLKKDGTVRAHGAPGVCPPSNCSGSGEKPRAVVASDVDDRDEQVSR